MRVVEDDAKVAAFILEGFHQAGLAVDHAVDGEAGLHLALTVPYDAAVIDIMLPKRDGLTLIAELRQRKLRTPVIILSAKGSVDDRVRGLQTGSDDYLTKPFIFVELLARVQALLRRASAVAAPTHLTAGELAMDLLTRQVSRAGEPIALPPREFALLEYLLHNVGRVVSKTMILEHVWDYTFVPQTNVVDVLVCRLRDKIDRDFAPPMLHTMRGVGYVLKVP